jgi:dolichyl-diphosphooligosaccharide--protein glycosyltransferase
LPLTAAVFYSVAAALGLSIPPMYTPNPLNLDPVFNLCVIFPVIMATLTCLAMYFLGKDIGGPEVGLFSAFFLALNSSYISRTSLGFFDDESVGIFGIILFIFFFLRSIEPERSLRNSLTYGVAAGLSLGYIIASWGASRYPIGMTVLFVFVLLLLRRYSSRLLLSYSATFGVALFIAVNVPLVGFRFLTEASTLAVFGMFLLLCLAEASSHIRSTKVKTVFVFGFLVACIALFVGLSWLGYIGALGTKYLSVLNPYTRLEHPLIESVQEHRPTAWGSFYFDLGIGVFFIPVGLFFAAQNPTSRNLFLCIFGVTALYFASSMVRLTLLMAPAVSILWAVALVRLLRPFITILKEVPALPRRRIGLRTHVGKEFSAAFLVLTLLLLTFTFVLPSSESYIGAPRTFDHAYTPTTLASASLPIKPTEAVSDWFNALNWIRTTDSVRVVASWWDYGYWITTIGNKISLADNGTWNWTQIEKIGLMFMSNETRAIEILKEYDATHVLVFTTFRSDGSDQGWGDEGKWFWMARIANGTKWQGETVRLYEEDFGSRNEETGAWEWSAEGNATVIYKLMQYARETRLGLARTVQLEHFEQAYFSEGSYYGQVVPLVCIYKINYE